jgi:hypothetical protein
MTINDPKLQDEFRRQQNDARYRLLETNMQILQISGNLGCRLDIRVTIAGAADVQCCIQLSRHHVQ